MRFLVDASTQSTPPLQTGNTSAWVPLWSITQTSRSASAGAIETSHHLSGNACISLIGYKLPATRMPALIRINLRRHFQAALRPRGESRKWADGGLSHIAPFRGAAAILSLSERSGHSAGRPPQHTDFQSLKRPETASSIRCASMRNQQWALASMTCQCLLSA